MNRQDIASRLQGRVSLVASRSIPCRVSTARLLQIGRRVCSKPWSCMLLSGGDHDCSRYSFLAWDPFLVLTAKNRSVTLIDAWGEATVSSDPTEVMDQLLVNMAVDHESALPFSGGAFGYLAYEMKHHMENLPRKAWDDLQLPDMVMLFPQRILIHDNTRKRLHFLRLSWSEGGTVIKSRSGQDTSLFDAPLKGGDVKSNFTRDAYMEAVDTIRRSIEEGDVYQVNLSQRFSFALRGNPYDLWQQLFACNPAPFYAYVHCPDHCIMSTSMERFLCKRGNRLETRPIKGTRPRGKSCEEDRVQKEGLLSHEKDDAELSMIVDLLRNDLGRVCRPGTVRVREHKRLETYQNVFHMVSRVTGELETERFKDIVRATFPGGSVTGCPKIRAMEIIDELEPHVRHIFTGSIGYVDFHGDMDFNIAIRTAIYKQGRCWFSAGGGVVYDSDPKAEYEETLDKAGSLLDVLTSISGERDET